MILPADNVAWEDPRIDQHLLRMGAEDTLLVLTTGGCNVLDRLIDGTKHIVAADLNAAQNALLELKLACERERPPPISGLTPPSPPPSP